VLALVVFVDQGLRQARGVGIDLLGQAGHFGQLFEEDAVLHRLCRDRSPGEGVVAGDQFHKVKMTVPWRGSSMLA